MGNVHPGGVLRGTFYEFLYQIDRKNVACMSEPLYVTSWNITLDQEHRLRYYLDQIRDDPGSSPYNSHDLINQLLSKPDPISKQRITITTFDHSYPVESLSEDNRRRVVKEDIIEPAFSTPFTDCLASEYQYIIVPVFLRRNADLAIHGVNLDNNTLDYAVKITGSHANALLINNVLGEIELFEPNIQFVGDPDKNINTAIPNLDQYMQFYLQDLGVFDEYIFYPALSFCPRYLQAKQEITNFIRLYNPLNWWYGEVYQPGFCAYWTLYWIALRISHPEMSREKLSEYLTSKSMTKLDDMIKDFYRTLNARKSPRL